MTRRAYHRASVDERRRELIEATLDCIAEFGLHGATVRQIAIRAGVTGGLIRHYFSSKEQMVQAAFRETMTGMTDQAVEQVNAVGADPRERLKAFILANLSGPVTDSRSLSLWASFISQVRVDPALAADYGWKHALRPIFLPNPKSLLWRFLPGRPSLVCHL